MRDPRRRLCRDSRAAGVASLHRDARITRVARCSQIRRTGFCILFWLCACAAVVCALTPGALGACRVRVRARDVTSSTMLRVVSCRPCGKPDVADTILVLSASHYRCRRGVLSLALSVSSASTCARVRVVSRQSASHASVYSSASARSHAAGAAIFSHTCSRTAASHTGS